MTSKAWLIIGIELILSFLIIYLLLGQVSDAKKRADDAEQSLSLANATITDMQKRQRDVAALDAKYTKELSDAKKTINDLRRDVDSGAKRLRIAATCPGVSKATSASGVDDAGSPELTPDARRNYFDHRDGIATADKMIRGMQDYIKEQCLK
ncbi:lysis protein [Enterobacter kobei]|uniref:lysis protein n=1 Tax=Enterobacter kobei TaxID=208224 RepID=UPI002915134A|nr:lysis protein [Enterobacter kobei]